MSLGGKWIEGIRTEGSVVDAARVSLSSRLAAVGHWLPLAAAESARDVEYIHQLRVSTRRAGAAMRLYRDWLPRKEYRWLKKRLQKIRRAAGAARDLDVLTARIGSDVGVADEGLRANIAEQRAAAQEAIVRTAARSTRGGRLARKVQKLLDGTGSREAQEGSPPQTIEFRTWARDQLTTAANDFFAAVPQDFRDTNALHQFRIAAKKLRYAIELLAPAFELELRKEHYPIVEEVQERLGKINDYVVGARQLRTWSGEISSTENRSALADLAARDDERLAHELESFREWWAAEGFEALRRGLLPSANSSVASRQEAI